MAALFPICQGFSWFVVTTAETTPAMGKLELFLSITPASQQL
jgi:hypothetical protein